MVQIEDYSCRQVHCQTRLSIHRFIYIYFAFARRCSVKKVLLAISQNSQESTCARVSFLIKLQALVSFAFFFTFLLCFAFFLLVCFLKLKIYILMHIRLCERLDDKNFFTRPVSGNKTTFFGLILINAIISKFSRTIDEKLNESLIKILQI